MQTYVQCYNSAGFCFDIARYPGTHKAAIAYMDNFLCGLGFTPARRKDGSVICWIHPVTGETTRLVELM